MKRKSSEEEALSAIQRLVDGRPTIAKDSRLLDRNLFVEAKLAKATFYRLGNVVKVWQAEKEKAVRGAIVRLKKTCEIDTEVQLTDRDLWDAAGIDPAALRRMDDQMLTEWHRLRDRHRLSSRPRSPVKAGKDTVDRLRSVILALDAALEQKDALIKKYRKLLKSPTRR